MDDSEARYLIDQYNKYASWKTRHGELELVGLAVAVATTGLAVSIAGWFWRTSTTDTIVMVLPVPMLLLVFVMLVIGWREHLRIRRAYEDHEKRLTALERYRSRNKSLPDTLTFSKIIKFEEFKTEDMEKLLQKSEQEIARHGRL